MPNYRIWNDQDDTYFSMKMIGDQIHIFADKQDFKTSIACIGKETGLLKLNVISEERFEQLGIDYKKREDGGGCTWYVEE